MLDAKTRPTMAEYRQKQQQPQTHQHTDYGTHLLRETHHFIHTTNLIHSGFCVFVYTKAIYANIRLAARVRFNIRLDF